MEFQRFGEHYMIRIDRGQDDFSTFGGHLNECRISGTCELHLIKFPESIGRQYDPVTGLNIYDFQKQ